MDKEEVFEELFEKEFRTKHATKETAKQLFLAGVEWCEKKQIKEYIELRAEHERFKKKAVKALMFWGLTDSRLTEESALKLIEETEL
jgi:hypothetical protein